MKHDVCFNAALQAQLLRIAGDCDEEMWWNMSELEDRAIQAREKLRRMYAERAAAVGMTLSGYCARFGVKI